MDFKGVDSKLVYYTLTQFIGDQNNIVDWSYSDLGGSFSKTLFLLMKSNFVYVYSYCPAQDETSDDSYSFEVYNPKEVAAFKKIIVKNDM